MSSQAGQPPPSKRASSSTAGRRPADNRPRADEDNTVSQPANTFADDADVPVQHDPNSSKQVEKPVSIDQSEGRVAVITGAPSGIGAAPARASAASATASRSPPAAPPPPEPHPPRPPARPTSS